MPTNGGSPITFMIIKSGPKPMTEEEKKAAEKESKKDEINPASVKGEPGTGYEDPGGKGEFECENCSYFDYDSLSCGQADMMDKSKRAKLTNGRVVVHPEGCCEYVNRIGSDDYDKNAD